MASNVSLRQLALNAGAKEELDTADFEVYLHGTIASFGSKIVESRGECLSPTGGNWCGAWHTVMNLETASIFASRRCQGTRGEQPMVVAMAIPRSVSTQLRSRGALSSPPIPNPPPGVSNTTPQYVFLPSSFPQLQGDGFFFSVKGP
jgi:hypothetical protein